MMEKFNPVQNRFTNARIRPLKVCIPQVKNLEDELVDACEIKNIAELTKSGTKKEYKRDLISCSNLGARLKKCQFDIKKFWNKMPVNKFRDFGNDAEKVKIY